MLRGSLRAQMQDSGVTLLSWNIVGDGRWTARARGYNTGIETCMGRTAVLEIGQVKILLAEHSTMTVDPLDSSFRSR